MKSRWLRTSVLSLAVVSAVAVTACSRAGSPDVEATQKAPVTAGARAEVKKGPGYRLFREIDKLDLRAEQRASIREVEENLAADLSTHKETIRQVAETLARGVESGKLDEESAKLDESALLATVDDMRGAFTQAMNDVHDALDQEQREELVVTLRQKRWHAHEQRGDEAEGQRRERLDKVMAELALTEEQKKVLHDEMQAHADRAFPDRKARREAWEQKMQALGDAFMGDDFDAADFDLWEGSEDAIASFTTTANQAVSVSGRVLDKSQRFVLASLLRQRAAEM